MGGADRFRRAHPRIYRARLCHRDLGAARTGRAGLARRHAEPGHRGEASSACRTSGPGALPRCDAGDDGADCRCRRALGDYRRCRLERQGPRAFPALRRAARHSGGHGFPPPGRDFTRERGLCRQSRLRTQPRAGRTRQTGRPDPRHRRAARGSDHRWLHRPAADRARAQAGSRPPRCKRTQPRLPRRSGHLRQHG